MRDRLLRSTLTIALVAIVTLGVPLLLLARHQVWTSARDGLSQQAASVAAGLEDQLDAGGALDLDHYAAALPHRRVVVVGPTGTVTAAGARLTGPVLQASVAVTDSTVTVQAARGPTVVRAREVSLLVGGLALLAVATAVGLTLRQARRLTRPLSDLFAHAEALGRGELGPEVERSGIPEIDGVSQVLERSARQLGTLLELQRDFASDAAHQLRTPLTGIGLRLEELTRIGDAEVRQEAEDALTQVERLDRVITALLARARGDAAAPSRLELGALLAHEAPAWSAALAEQGRDLALDVEPDLLVRARRDHLAGILSCLLDNALHHGRGTVSVVARSGSGSAVLRVSDEGPGVPPSLAPRVFDRHVSGKQGTGIGLALARSLAQAEEGTLALDPADPACFVLSLPQAP